jgi:superfamily II DNA helicase RecQ
VSHKHNQLTFDELLRQRLKEWREGLDDVNTLFSENVVPQEERKFRNGWGCISNSDIENLIDQVPRSMNDLQAIPGIGPTKLNKYGDSLLEVIEKTTEEYKS